MKNWNKRMVAYGAAIVAMAILHGYIVGSAPWCTVDSQGNYTCFYYSISSARDACRVLVDCEIAPNPEAR